MFLDVNMFYIYVTMCDKNPEVMILDINVLCARSNLRWNREYNLPLIVFIKCDWILGKDCTVLSVCLLEY